MNIDYHYIIFILVLLYLTFSKGNEEKKFKIAVWFSFLFIGLRACVVGADLYYYTRGYMGMDFYKGEEIEPLYKLYVEILSSIIKYEPFFVLMNTICSLVPVYFLIRSYSTNKTLSILCFFLFNIYLFYFIALRQILGLGVLILGVLYVLKEKRMKWAVYLLSSIIAYRFHSSMLIPALLFIILFFLKLKSRKFALSIIITTAIVGIIGQIFDLQKIFNLFLNLNTGLTTDRLNEYMVNSSHTLNAHENSGYIYLLRYTWLGLFVFYFMDEDKLNHWFSKIFLISICLYNLFYNVDMISRMVLSFYFFSIIVFTWAFGERYKRIISNAKYLKIIPLFIFLWFFQSYIRSHIGYKLDDVDRLHPYYFFWENYQTHPSITRF